MSTLRRRTTLSALVLAVGLAGAWTGGPSGAQAAPATAKPVDPADLPRLQAELAHVTEQARKLDAALQEQAARDGGLRREMTRLEEEHDAAQARLDERVRAVYITGRRDPIAEVAEGIAHPGLRRIVRQGQEAGVTVDRALVDAVAHESERARELRSRAAAFRTRLLEQAADVLAAQERARRLLADAEQAVAAAQAAAEARELDAAAVAATATTAATLASARSTLDEVSASVTRSLTPAQTRRSRLSAEREAPVLALVEAAGSGYPRGYAPTGTVLRGLASWYGPGFVGSPTASGTPYDPERLTCAHKALPLGTVLRVSANGRAVSCLVNDRGPYVGPRILDMSRAGSRALGYDGVAQVVIEVLGPR